MNPLILSLVLFFLGFLSVRLAKGRAQKKQKEFEKVWLPGLRYMAEACIRLQAFSQYLFELDPSTSQRPELEEAILQSRQAFLKAQWNASERGFHRFLPGNLPENFLSLEEQFRITGEARNQARMQVADRILISSGRPEQGGQAMARSSAPDEAKRQEEIRQKQDEFLDAFLDWKATHRIAERTRLLELARQLKELDPSFQFDTIGI